MKWRLSCLFWIRDAIYTQPVLVLGANHISNLDVWRQFEKGERCYTCDCLAGRRSSRFLSMYSTRSCRRNPKLSGSVLSSFLLSVRVTRDAQLEMLTGMLASLLSERWSTFSPVRQPISGGNTSSLHAHARWGSRPAVRLRTCVSTLANGLCRHTDARTCHVNAARTLAQHGSNYLRTRQASTEARRPPHTRVVLKFAYMLLDSHSSTSCVNARMALGTARIWLRFA